MKILAFYLPQFHEIPENNRWWGKGFTDWVNVKKAVPLFAGHRQPRIPLNGYYDLSNAQVISEQARLAKEYGVDGFCIYHYWFAGKPILEKPAQLLLEHKEIETEYCFSWANESWTRSWDGRSKEVILKQEYGKEQDWEKHFEFLLPYFKDSRYIKVDNKPMILIYKYRDIPQFAQMMYCWDQLAVKSGFAGIYKVETLRDAKGGGNALFDAEAEFEPLLTLNGISVMKRTCDKFRRSVNAVVNKLTHRNKPVNKVAAYQDIVKKSLNRKSRPKYGGVFLGWDNSPRRECFATFVTEPSAEEFEYYLNAKMKQSDGFLFINAWNEWAEGTYLEPDTVNKYRYLETVKRVKNPLK